MRPEQTLRSELGDADYEKYLQAQGRPTKVGVFNVLPSSPAAKAGMQPGDQIMSYAGQRVFNMADLTDLTLQGTPGQSVTLEVQRNQQTVQLVIPRGPIGIGGVPAEVPAARSAADPEKSAASRRPMTDEVAKGSAASFGAPRSTSVSIG